MPERLLIVDGGSLGMQAQDLALFKAALGLTEPWQVTSVEFDPATKRLDLRIDFPRGATFCCPECDVAGLKARDTEEKTWRHLDFFEQQSPPENRTTAA